MTEKRLCLALLLSSFFLHFPFVLQVLTEILVVSFSFNTCAISSFMYRLVNPLKLSQYASCFMRNSSDCICSCIYACRLSQPTFFVLPNALLGLNCPFPKSEVGKVFRIRLGYYVRWEGVWGAEQVAGYAYDSCYLLSLVICTFLVA